MAERRQLDLRHLRVGTVPLQVILGLSAALGVILGLGLIIVAAFITTLMVPLGFIAALAAILATATHAAHLAVLGGAAVALIPLGALIAAWWKLRHAETFILEDCAAQRADPNSKIGQVLAVMARSAGLPDVPRYAIVEDVFNAFAMSSDRSVGLVLLGRPLVNTLKPAETLAILGHEIGHIAMLDSKRKFLAESHQEFLVTFLVFAGLKRLGRSLFGFVGELALAAHSREREYWADAVGAHLTSVSAMVSALESLHGLSVRPTRVERRYAPLMFRSLPRLFATHPSVEKRIAALQAGTYVGLLPLRQVEQEEVAEGPSRAFRPVYRGI